MNKQDLLIYGIVAVGIIILVLVVLPPFLQTKMSFAQVLEESQRRMDSIRDLDAKYTFVFISELDGTNESGQAELKLKDGSETYNFELKNYKLSENSLFGISPLEIVSLVLDSSLMKAEYTGKAYFPRPCYLTRVWMNGTSYNTEIENPHLIGVVSCFDLKQGLPLQLFIFVEKNNKAISAQFAIINATFK